jgi:hypothetical protein
LPALLKVQHSVPAYAAVEAFQSFLGEGRPMPEGSREASRRNAVR